MKHPATVCWLSGEVSVHRLQGKPEEVTLVWQKWAMVQPFGNHRVVATTSLPKIPMNFPLQNLPISPASFPRQVRGLTTDTHFEELMKTFCRCAEINPLDMPKTGAGSWDSTSHEPSAQQEVLAPLHAWWIWAGSGGSEENSLGDFRIKWAA